MVLRPAIEDRLIQAYDLGEYHAPLVVLVPYEAPVPAEMKLPVSRGHDSKGPTNLDAAKEVEA